MFEGASLRYWVERSKHPDSVFHGFDSFEGLPETFDAEYPVGKFDKQGRVPDIDDARIRYHVGWFDVTLPAFEGPVDHRLVITLDADLYSATKLVLGDVGRVHQARDVDLLRRALRIDHEPARPSTTIARATGKHFEPLAFEQTLNTGAFICR